MLRKFEDSDSKHAVANLKTKWFKRTMAVVNLKLGSDKSCRPSIYKRERRGCGRVLYAVGEIYSYYSGSA